MTLKEIYAKVSLAVPTDQQEFLNTRREVTKRLVPPDQTRFFYAYEATINELCELFPGFVFDAKKGTAYTDDADVPEGAWIEKDIYYIVPDSLTDGNVARPLFTNAIVDNIVYLLGLGGEMNEVFKTEFVRKARSAYLKYWSDDAKGRIIKRARW